MILFHPDIISFMSSPRGTHKPNPHFIDHITTVSFEILAADLGSLFVASVYVKHYGQKPDYEHLVDSILGLCPPTCTHLLIGGDFNYPAMWSECHGIMQDLLGVTSVVDPGQVKATHDKGNILDHILISPSLSNQGLVVTPLPLITDHHLLSLTLTLTQTLTTNPLPKAPPPPLFPLSKFRRFRRSLLKKKPPPTPEVVETARRLSEGARELALQPITDLAQLNTELLAMALQHFPVPKARARLQRPYMFKSSVRQVVKRRRKVAQRYNKKKRRGGDIREVEGELRALDKEWERARRKAQRDQWDDQALAMEKGDISLFYAQYQQQRMAKSAPTPPTKLNVEDAIAYNAAKFEETEDAAFIRNTVPPPPIKEEEIKLLAVSPDEVKEALKQTKDKCWGPDNVPPLLWKHCGGELTENLAKLFTQCLHHGISPALRHGLLTLISKVKPPSSRPEEYRPITLLPAIVRVLLRVVDNKLRKLIKEGKIKVPVEQAGFLPNCSTHLQCFALELERDYARHRLAELYAAFLDIEGAFDNITHSRLLEVLPLVGVPPALVDAIHRLLPFFTLELFGATFPQDKGTFQGGPLSPLLCVLFLVDLILYINGNEASAFYGTKLPWSSSQILEVIRLLLFADDIVLLAESVEQLQVALDLAAIWVEKRGLRYGYGKCKVMRLARKPKDRRTILELPPLTLQGHTLDWVSEFKYLGHMITAAPEYKKRRPSALPVDKDKVRGLCYALSRVFSAPARCIRIAPMAVRLGVLHVIHAKYLYPTAILDIDYDILDKQIVRSLRNTFGLPLCTPTAQVHADLGVWPSQYYAHKRALQMLWKLRWRYWTKEAFDEWLGPRADSSLWPTGPTPLEEWPSRQPSRGRRRPVVVANLSACLEPRWAPKGVLHRFTRILETYELSWHDLNVCGDEKAWKWCISEALHLAFARYCQRESQRYNHPLLADAKPTMKPRIQRCLRIGGELAIVAIRMRSPRLRLLTTFKPTDHGICRQCGHGPENGSHIIFCPALPHDLRTTKESIAEAIAREAGVPVTATRKGQDIMKGFIMNFQWPHQSTELLKALLVFCRNLLNKYAACKPQWEKDLDAYPVRRARPLYRRVVPGSK